jgi:quinol monooxygenase YgiN
MGGEAVMATNDKCCTIAPYFKVNDGRLADFKALCERFMAKTGEETKCHYYGFSFDGHHAHCREGYEDAAGLLAHLENVGALLQESLTMAELTRLEVHGPESELAKLREPLKALNPQFFALEYGFRR